MTPGVDKLSASPMLTNVPLLIKRNMSENNKMVE
jgi:hypothetical protein